MAEMDRFHVEMWFNSDATKKEVEDWFLHERDSLWELAVLMKPPKTVDDEDFEVLVSVNEVTCDICGAVVEFDKICTDRHDNTVCEPCSKLEPVLSAADKVEVYEGFFSRTGVAPQQADDVLRLMYLEQWLPTTLDRQLVEPWLRSLK